ncbi:PhzF family phenazine biosynthesis protein [Oxalobacteraceae bacterium OM1]|nr:PhzF family phenazine biosynthesis protein [Oxalobacteraceae bacterium OM1]
MDVGVQVVNAFVDGGKGGNPAGVVLGADAFSREQKQAIAAQVGLSETAFVSRSEVADFKLEFFTPNRQIAHCGHATIATFSFLQQSGRVPRPDTSKETIDGCRAVQISGDMAFMEQLAPSYSDTGMPAAELLAGLGLHTDDLLDGRVPEIVHTGNAFLIVPLKDEAAVARARPDLVAIEAVSERFDLIGYYLFSPQTRIAGRHAGTRMFAPRYGIAEEAATGMAAGPLACYLHDRLNVRADGDILIEQGHLMNPPSPSVIHVRLDLDDDRIRRLMAGGRAAVTERRAISL